MEIIPYLRPSTNLKLMMHQLNILTSISHKINGYNTIQQLLASLYNPQLKYIKRIVNSKDELNKIEACRFPPASFNSLSLHN